MPASILASQQGAWRFSPASLFAASEPGVWFDPSDMSTMFQDAAGTTPVTAAGQPVALLLDKSQGLVRGPELRQSGVIVNYGVPPSPASYDPLTGGGSLSRTDSANMSGVAFTTGVSAEKFYEVDFENTSAPGIVLSLRTSGIFQVLYNWASGQRRTVRVRSVSADLQILADTNGSTATFTLHSIRELPGNHATQVTPASRPAYQIDGTGRPYLFFDGLDDGMVTPTITPGVGRIQLFGGMRKLTDASVGAPVEYSVNSSSTPNTFGMITSNPLTAQNISFRSTGTGSNRSATIPTPAVPTSLTVIGIGDIPNSICQIWRNGVLGAENLLAQGGTVYDPHVLFIGRRAGASLPFNGQIYSLITRFGPTLSPEQITATETWVNGKTGAY